MVGPIVLVSWFGATCNFLGMTTSPLPVGLLSGPAGLLAVWTDSLLEAGPLSEETAQETPTRQMTKANMAVKPAFA